MYRVPTTTHRHGRARRRGAAFVFAIALATVAGYACADDLGEHLAACAVCHGKHGEGVQGAQYYPHLAGKPVGYLFEQLRNFRDGRRNNAQMTWLVQYMDDAYMDEIAQFYAAQPPRTRAADSDATGLSEAMNATAQQLVQHGDPARDIPACSACHGIKLTGLEPGIPALVGLPAEYIFAQLGSWRTGARHATEPDCMGTIARDLAPQEMRAIAAWLSRQSHADEERPAPAGSFLPPRACGQMPYAKAAP